MIREYSIYIYSYLITKSLLTILSIQAKLADSKSSSTAGVTEHVTNMALFMSFQVILVIK